MLLLHKLDGLVVSISPRGPAALDLLWRAELACTQTRVQITFRQNRQPNSEQLRLACSRAAAQGWRRPAPGVEGGQGCDEPLLCHPAPCRQSLSVSSPSAMASCLLMTAGKTAGNVTSAQAEGGTLKVHMSSTVCGSCICMLGARFRLA